MFRILAQGNCMTLAKTMIKAVLHINDKQVNWWS